MKSGVLRTHVPILRSSPRRVDVQPGVVPLESHLDITRHANIMASGFAIAAEYVDEAPGWSIHHGETAFAGDSLLGQAEGLA